MGQRRETLEQALLNVQGDPQTLLILGPQVRCSPPIVCTDTREVFHPTFNLSKPSIHASSSAWPSTAAGHNQFSHKASSLCCGQHRGQGLGQWEEGRQEGELFGTVWRPGKDKEVTSEASRLDLMVRCVEL